MKTLQDEFREKIGEVAYTSNQVVMMLTHLGLNWYSYRMIRYYINKNNLTVPIEKLGINPWKYKSSGKYFIAKSNLQDIIDGLDIKATVSDLENAANDLDYQV